MLGHKLTIEKGEVANPEACNEPCERDLRSIGSAAEHALAKESAAELHAVETADELIAFEDLDRVGVARALKRDHRMLELGIDPGLLAFGAGGDHAGEIPVMSY